MKKTTIFFGAVAVVLLLVSSSTVISQEAIEISENEERSVNPEICLTTEDLPILYTSLLATNDPEIEQLIQDVIDLVEDKGFASVEDIEQLDLPDFLDGEMTNSNYPIGIIRASNTNGYFSVPRILMRFMFCGPKLFWTIWLDEGGLLTINGNSIHGTASINTFFFIGYGHCSPCAPFGFSFIYRIVGIGFGINVNGGGLESTPVSTPTGN